MPRTILAALVTSERPALTSLALASGFLFVTLVSCGNSQDVAESQEGMSPELGLEVSVHDRRTPADVGRSLVPSSYQETAVGFLHPSCVIELEEGEEELADGSIRAADGTVRPVPPCGHPRYDAQGNELAPTAMEPLAPVDPSAGDPAADASTSESSAVRYTVADTAEGLAESFTGWLAYAYDYSNGPLKYLSATWRVPRDPTARETQRLAYFPGLEVLGSAETTILQPVLRWYAPQGGWSILSEHCCFNGNAIIGKRVQVNVGDEIFGSVTGVDCDQKGVCQKWIVYVKDQTTGQSTQVTTASHGQVFDAAVMALEGFGFTGCAHHSATGSVSYKDITAIKANGELASRFKWNVGQPTAKSPCHERVVVAPDARAVDLSSDVR